MRLVVDIVTIESVCPVAMDKGRWRQLTSLYIDI